MRAKFYKTLVVLLSLSNSIDGKFLDLKNYYKNPIKDALDLPLKGIIHVE